MAGKAGGAGAALPPVDTAGKKRRWGIPLGAVVVVFAAVWLGIGNQSKGGDVTPVDGNTVPTVELTAAEREWLRNHPVIRVACDPDWAPIEYIDAGGRFRGIAQEYLQLVERMLGVRFTIARGLSWAQLVEKVKRKELDMFSAVAVAPERRSFLVFTRPFLRLPNVVFTRSDVHFIAHLDELADRKVAVVDGYISQMWMVRDHPRVPLVPVRTVDDGLMLLQQRRVQAFIGDILTASYAIDAKKISDIKVAGETPYHYELAMAARIDWPELAAILEKALASIPEWQRRLFYQKWVVVQYEYRLDTALILWILGGMLLVVAVVFVFWNRRLRREVRLRRRAENDLIQHRDHLEELVGARTRELETANRQMTQEIEERRRIAEALRQNEEKYRNLFHFSHDAIFIFDQQGTLLDVNNRALEKLGYSREEVMQRHIEDFVAADGLPLARRALQMVRQAGGIHFEVDFRCRDGRIFNGEVAAGMFNIGGVQAVQGIVRDISDRKRSEAAFRESELRYRTLFEASGDAVFLVRGDVFSECNRSTLQIFGVGREEIIGRTPFDFSPPRQPDGRDSRDAMLDRISAAYRGERQIFEWQHRRLDGGEFPAEIILARMEIGGEAQLQAIVRDITERKRVEEELRRYRLNLEELVAQRTAQLEEANKELEAFAYSVSHDLRAPLRHILGFGELLENRLRGNSDERSRHLLGNINDSARQMSQLIDDLLEFSRTGRSELRRAPVDMKRVVEEARAALAAECTGRTVVWQVEELPVVQGDLPMIRQVVINLLANALKFSRPRAEARVRIGARRDKSGWVFSVGDNGVGFDPDYAAKLFGIFQRLHSREQFEGTGVGLANVRRIIHRHGGHTWAEGAPDQGATFFFTLPDNPAGRTE